VYASSGAISIAPHPGATSSHLGSELDLIAEYKQNPHVSYGSGFCHLFAGQYLNEATHGKDYKALRRNPTTYPKSQLLREAVLG
jgi:hypothetical protein